MRAAASPKYLCIFTFYSRFILDLAPLRQFINKLFTPLITLSVEELNRPIEAETKANAEVH